jgi:EAL domain-containing protein (putative c-di-GMP-specific phosphodiesterase class I)
MQQAPQAVAVNISGRQLMRADFVETVMQVLQDTGANPARLKLELTESVLVKDVENTIAKRIFEMSGVRHRQLPLRRELVDQLQGHFQQSLL